MESQSIPISTRWLLDAVGETGRSAVNAVYLVVCPRMQSKGTGFLLKSGVLVTNWHVICHCQARVNLGAQCQCDPRTVNSDVLAFDSNGQQQVFRRLAFDQHRDLAMLEPSTPLAGGLTVRTGFNIAIGTQICTWGHPLGYDGPAPVLTMGYVSGFVARKTPVIKHFVVNAAFNPGNSGGPLLVAGEGSVIGVVVSKHAPISRRLASIIEVLSKQQSGVVYYATDDQGNRQALTEAQLVAEVLLYFRQMTQVVLGEAIHGEELIAFLRANHIPIE
ncbi:MAG: trypsin-like peptidase domain-containing protein [Chloroflexi bacterium]|nr:trypsin-like peptidase domain-containing protein [Chloroflexota bacterium]